MKRNTSDHNDDRNKRPRGGDQPDPRNTYPSRNVTENNNSNTNFPFSNNPNNNNQYPTPVPNFTPNQYPYPNPNVNPYNSNNNNYNNNPYPAQNFNPSQSPYPNPNANLFNSNNNNYNRSDRNERNDRNNRNDRDDRNVRNDRNDRNNRDFHNRDNRNYNNSNNNNNNANLYETRLVDIKANYFKFMLHHMPGMFQYTVKFDPPVLSKRVRGGLLGEIGAAIAGFIPAGDQLYLPKLIPKLVTTVVSRPRPRRGMKPDEKRGTDSPHVPDAIHYTITIEPAVNVRVEGQALRTPLNIMFHRMMLAMQYQPIGRGGYFNSNKSVSIGDLKVWPGFKVALEALEDGIYLVSDPKSKILRTDSVWKTLSGMRDVGEMRIYMRNLIVYTKYNNLFYRVLDVLDNRVTNMSNKTFEKDGKSITILQYFQISYPDLLLSNQFDKDQVLLECAPPGALSSRPTAARVYLPSQFCCFTGLSEAHRSDNTQLKALKKETDCTPAQAIERTKVLIHGFANPELRKASNLSQWEFGISTVSCDVKAIELGQEKVLMRKNSPEENYPNQIVPTRVKGEFSNFANLIYYSLPFEMMDWEIVSPSNTKQQVEQFEVSFTNVAKSVGINLRQARLTFLQSASPHEYNNLLLDPSRNKANFFVVCVLCDKRQSATYNAIKNCMTQVPVINQCVVVQTMQDYKKLRSVCGKIMLQIAAKHGGAPWGIDFRGSTLTGPTMILGIDISSASGNTVVGLVASMNVHVNRFYHETYPLPLGAHVATYLQRFVQAAVVKFKEGIKRFPDTIIVYRDGLGEGQMKVVMDAEEEQIRAGATNAGSPEIELIMICVQKKTSTRLYTKDNKNVDSGTVVNSFITASTGRLEHLGAQFDFHMVAQCNMQGRNEAPGTMKPAHYWVRHPKMSTSKYDAHVLFRLTYQICHIYFNWTGTVATPAICKYAKKLAMMRAKVLNANVHPALQTKLFFV